MSKKHAATSTPDKVKRQREAKAEMERMTQPVMMETSDGHMVQSASSSAQPQRTLKEKLADVDRRAKERAEQEKAALAGDYLKDATAKYKRLLSVTKDEELKAAYEEMTELEKMVGHSVTGAPSESAGGRVKRSKDQLAADAETLAKFLIQNPDSPSSALEDLPDYGVSLKAFIEKYTKHKVGKKGERADATWHIK